MSTNPLPSTVEAAFREAATLGHSVRAVGPLAGGSNSGGGSSGASAAVVSGAVSGAVGAVAGSALASCRVPARTLLIEAE